MCGVILPMPFACFRAQLKVATALPLLFSLMLTMSGMGYAAMSALPSSGITVLSERVRSWLRLTSQQYTEIAAT